MSGRRSTMVKTSKIVSFILSTNQLDTTNQKYPDLYIDGEFIKTITQSSTQIQAEVKGSEFTVELKNIPGKGSYYEDEILNAVERICVYGKKAGSTVYGTDLNRMVQRYKVNTNANQSFKASLDTKQITMNYIIVRDAYSVPYWPSGGITIGTQSGIVYTYCGTVSHGGGSPVEVVLKSSVYNICQDTFPVHYTNEDLRVARANFQLILDGQCG